MDFQTSLGVARVSPRLKLNTNGLDGCPVAFRYFDTKIWAIAGTKIYGNGGLPSSISFSEDASSGVQTDYTSDESDMEVFNGTLVTSTTDGLFSKASNSSGTGAWTQRDILNTGGYHGMTYFKKFDRLYYSNQQDNILSIDTSWATADPGASYAISLSADSVAYTITCLRSTSSRIWIGIIDKTNEMGRGKILEWDGISSQITNEYKLEGQGCLAMVVDYENDAIYAMDSRGVLLGFSGGGFREVGRLPITDKLLDQANAATTNRFIHPNGLMFTKERTIIALVNNKNADGSYNENFQAGIYEFDLKGNCTHRYSPTYTTSTTVTDYGQSRLSRVGALNAANVYSASASRNGTFLAGMTYFTNGSSTSSGIFYDDSNDTVQKYGYFVTQWMESTQVKDFFQKLFVFFKQFLDSDDKIVLKYRKREISPTYIDITWASDTQRFITSTNLTGKEGYEVEILQGTGAGKTAHITNIATAGSNYVITLDDTFTGVTTGTGKARVQNWIKIREITDEDIESEEASFDGSALFRAQFKVCLQLTGKGELRRLGIINSNQQLEQ